MPFDFSRAKVKSAKVGKPVHVCKALLDIADANRGVKEVVSIVEHAAEYIKVLERELLAAQNSARPVINAHNHLHTQNGLAVDPSQFIGRANSHGRL